MNISKENKTSPKRIAKILVPNNSDEDGYEIASASPYNEIKEDDKFDTSLLGDESFHFEASYENGFSEENPFSENSFQVDKSPNRIENKKRPPKKPHKIEQKGVTNKAL